MVQRTLDTVEKTLEYFKVRSSASNGMKKQLTIMLNNTHNTIMILLCGAKKSYKQIYSFLQIFWRKVSRFQILWYYLCALHVSYTVPKKREVIWGVENSLNIHHDHFIDSWEQYRVWQDLQNNSLCLEHQSLMDISLQFKMMITYGNSLKISQKVNF